MPNIISEKLSSTSYTNSGQLLPGTGVHAVVAAWYKLSDIYPFFQAKSMVAILSSSSTSINGLPIYKITDEKGTRLTWLNMLIFLQFLIDMVICTSAFRLPEICKLVDI